MSWFRAAAVAAFLFVACTAHAQLVDPEWIGPDDDPAWFELDGLPIGMTAEEEAARGAIGADFTPTPPPSGPVRNIGEFERNEGVLIRFPLGIPLALVAAMSEHVRVVTLVANASQQSQATNAFQSAGVTMSNVQFLQAPTNSVWTRDYGPFYAVTEDNEVAIVDFPYNRPRPADDAVPSAMASFYGIDRYGMNVVHTGGNYMSTGWGHGASTDLVFEENGFNQNLVRQRMHEYLGIDPYLVTIDPQAEYIKHIDTWAKFLDVDKMVIARPSANDPRRPDYDAVADFFASQTSAWGTPYQVYRLDTPNDQPYTNALIMNERVYVPISSSAAHAALNEAALDVYREALPGYQVLGFTGTWQATDALHCRVKEIPDRGMLSILHRPVAGTVPLTPIVELDADIVSYAGATLIQDALQLHVSVNGMPFVPTHLEPVEGSTYRGVLPLQPGDVDVAYFFSAADGTGRTETYPLVGAPGARRFTVEHESVEQSYAAGWHLAGLPLRRTHTDYRQVFTEGEELLAATPGGYEAATTMEPGTGYWLRLAGAETVAFAGSPVEVPVATVTEGWNLIAAPFEPAAIHDAEGVLVAHTLTGFAGAYGRAEVLEPGRGYWVRAVADGVIALGAEAPPARPVLPFDAEAFHRVELRSGTAEAEVFFGGDLGDVDPASVSRPPLPPAGAFDARLLDDAWATSNPGAAVLVRQTSEPTVLTVSGQADFDGTYTLRFYAGDFQLGVATVEVGEEMPIPADANRLTVTPAGGTSVDDIEDPVWVTELLPVYPNPTGSRTRLGYTLAETGAVRLEVFNALGQRVATLVEEQQPAGRHGVTFDVSELSSGLYVVRLSAGGSVETRTLTVVR